MLALIESGEAGLVVGTHAVIQDKVKFKNLALAIIDEQHRFGVAQRLALRSKMTHEGQEPHLLMMTATPIPRTLAMSYYADLDVSTIDELPPGRTPIVTKLVNDARRDEVIDRIRAQIAAGPADLLGLPADRGKRVAWTWSTPPQTHAALSEALPGVMVGLLHSRMPVAEKKAVMSLFTEGVMARAGQHHGDRGRRRCAECVADGDRACRALRPVAAAPAARPGRARRGGVGLRAAVFDRRRAPAGRDGARAAQGDGRDE